MRTFLLVPFILLLAALPAAAVGYQWTYINPQEMVLWQDGKQLGNLRLTDGAYFRRVAPHQFEGPTTCPIDLPPQAAKTTSGKDCDCGYGCDCGQPHDCHCPSSRKQPVNPDGHEVCPCCGEECRCALGKLCKPTCPCVASSDCCHVDEDGVPNYGIGPRDDIPPGQTLLNGKPVSRQDLLKALDDQSKADVPNDHALLRVTVIGPDGVREPVLKDLAASAFKDQISLQDYTPDNWAVADAGFVTTGSPTIYLQAPDGTVLHRQDSYDGPQKLQRALQKALEQLRNPRPDYQPPKDPDLSKPAAPTLPASFQDVPTWAWLIGGAALLILLTRTTKEPQ